MTLRVFGKIEGEAKLAAKLAVLEPELRKPITAALERWSRRIEDTAQRLVPERTGALAASIGRETSSDGLTVLVGSSAPHAHLVEFGTAPHEENHPGTDPQPFMGPAYKLHGKGASRAIRAAVRRALREAARR